MAIKGGVVVGFADENPGGRSHTDDGSENGHPMNADAGRAWPPDIGC
jgi:hypothetical protein